MKKVNTKIYLNKTNSFAKASSFEEKYLLSLTPDERLSEVQFCREQYYKLNKIDGNRKRLRRVIKIIKQK